MKTEILFSIFAIFGDFLAKIERKCCFTKEPIEFYCILTKMAPVLVCKKPIVPFSYMYSYYLALLYLPP